ncbi:MAG: excinuclease ABC subunit C [Candidatus Omnitrophica bacterium]|nr:excinuclease ABC subunit C [Candidatus Omnitrophota bacterium]
MKKIPKVPRKETHPDLRALVNQIPMTPGVYFMKDEEGGILYIGKARILKNRVRSYFANRMQLPKIALLVSQIRHIDYIETTTEMDALLLEAQLIRKYQPKYNKELKDDKGYPLLKITAETYPRVVITRNKSDRKAFYYGPYTDARLLREAVNLINNLFPIRKCRRLPKAACLYYHIGQCLAPCIKPEVRDDYARWVHEIRNFLGGGKKSILDYLTERMHQASAELRFEDAQFFKEQIQALGKLKKKRFLPQNPEAGIGLAASLELKKTLGLEKLPERIVCFDVSNIQGDEPVASKVAFLRELPDKMGYRRYKIRTVEGIDDYAMMREALSRMLRGLKEGRESFIPDLIMIDGGKGHLAAAFEAMKEEGFEDTPLISIAKKFETIYSARRKAADAAAPAEDLNLAKDAPANHLLQKIRDEAHRFAVSYHRLLKEKNLQRSDLDEIPGIGEVRKRILLRHFDSLAELERCDAERLSALPGMSRACAEQIEAWCRAKAAEK